MFIESHSECPALINRELSETPDKRHRERGRHGAMQLLPYRPVDHGDHALTDDGNKHLVGQAMNRQRFRYCDLLRVLGV